MITHFNLNQQSMNCVSFESNNDKSPTDYIVNYYYHVCCLRNLYVQ